MPFKTIPPAYSAWQSMKQRCLNPNAKQYADYGGRGISICDRWINSYANFAADMGPKPKGRSLDRINNDGDYSPDNCRWATRREQQRNQRTTRKVVIGGKEYLAVELAEVAGIKTDAIVERAAKGLTYKEVVSPQKRVFREGLALGGLAFAKKKLSSTHCPNGHPFSGDNLAFTKLGHRRCRTCHREKERARQRRRKQ